MLKLCRFSRTCSSSKRESSQIKRLLIFCPAFVADCLETLEEIGMEAVEDFKEAGGEDLQLVPSLNSSPQWANGVASLLREKL